MAALGSRWLFNSIRHRTVVMWHGVAVFARTCWPLRLAASVGMLPTGAMEVVVSLGRAAPASVNAGRRVAQA